MKHRQGLMRQGFTLVELLVVIGIITVLISMLLPAVHRSQQQANTVVCASNLHQISIEMQNYANNNRGWLFPMGAPDGSGNYTTLGTNVPPNRRWPMLFFTFTHPDPDAPPYGAWPATIPAGTYNPLYDPAPWTPPIMICPSDRDAFEAHSYILNQHLALSPADLVKAATSLPERSQDNIIVIGEKVTSERDYYMEVYYDTDGTVNQDEFNAKVELHRHGTSFGSNYLYKDWSVRNTPPNDVLSDIDPWAVHTPNQANGG